MGMGSGVDNATGARIEGDVRIYVNTSIRTQIHSYHCTDTGTGTHGVCLKRAILRPTYQGQMETIDIRILITAGAKSNSM